MSVLDGEDRKAEGMARAYDNANGDWKSAAAQIVRNLAGSKVFFTVDDVWAQLDTQCFITGEHRAMGSIMRVAALNGLIVKTDRVVPTRRPCANRRPVAVWQSVPPL